MSANLRDRIGISIHAIAKVDAPTLLNLIIQSEQAGVKQLWATQGAPSTDLLTVFAAAFQRTESIRLGTSIVPAYPRHPLALAQQAATAFSLGPNRLRLGVGTSHRPSIEGVYGIKMEAPLEYLKEYITVLRAALWHARVDHRGRFFTAKVEMNHPEPVPLLMSALGEKSYHLAGEISDGAISWNVPAHHLLATSKPSMQAGAGMANRPVPPLIAHVPIVLTANPDEARTAARKALAVYARLPFYLNMWAEAGYPLQQDGSVSDDLIDNLVVWGDEATIASRLAQILDSGIDELLLTSIPAQNPTEERTGLINLIGSL